MVQRRWLSSQLALVSADVDCRVWLWSDLEETALMIPLSLAMAAICPLCAAGNKPIESGAGVDGLAVRKPMICNQPSVNETRLSPGIHRVPDHAMAHHFEEWECAAWPIVEAMEKANG